MQGGKDQQSGVVGVVLAGGQSRRMGETKALKTLAGRPMIAHVVDRFAPQVECCVLNVGADGGPFDACDLPIVRDAVQDHAGPLAGILSGMGWARDARPGADWIATAPCDTPFLPAGYVAALRSAAAATAAPIAIARCGRDTHFVCGLFSVSLHDELADLLAAGERRVKGWIGRYAFEAVDFLPVTLGAAAIDPFFNVNTPEDFAMAERLIQGLPL